MKPGIYQKFLAVCILIGLLSSCVDDENVPAGNVTNAKKPTVSDIQIKDVITTASTISIKGEVTAHNGYPVTERGICWGTTEELDILKDSHKSMTESNDSINLTADNLQSGTLYYFCLYAKNQVDVSYSKTASFTTTSGLGSVSTFIIENETRATSARAGGKILNQGEGEILERGVLYFKGPDFTDRDSIISTMAKDSFVCDLPRLSPATTYKVQAYVKNRYGIFRGDSVRFDTGTGLPELSAVSIITTKSNQAKVSANVISQGDTSLIERGFCWSKTDNPPNINNDTVLVVFSEHGLGYMEAILQPLTPNQTYHVAAFASNEFGTVYSPPITFKTSDNKPSVTTLGYEFDDDVSYVLYGRVTDIGDSNVHTVGICYSTNPNYLSTTSGAKVEIVLSPTLSETDGLPFDFSTGKINGLKGETTYYYRAYAMNGTNNPEYGNLSSFTTPPIFTLEPESFMGGRRIEGTSAYFAVGEKGYVLGGDKGPTYVNNLYSFFPFLNEQWHELDSYPAGSMSRQSIAVMDTKVYVLGGFGSDHLEKDDFYSYDIASNMWISKPVGPPPAYSRAGFSLGNEVVYVGGMKDTAKNEVWAYNVYTNVWTQKTDFPVHQYGGIAVNIKNTIYAGLGKNTANVGNTQLWKSNGALSAWIPEPSGSILSGNVIMGTVYDDKIYVIDKTSSTRYTIFEYNPGTQEWKRKSDLPTYNSLEISFMFTIRNRIYIGFANNDKVITYNPIWDN